MREIFINILLNISVLILIAYVITKLHMVQQFIGAERYTLANKIGLGVLFGFIGIISTYIGIPVEGAIANTRVIGVLTGGVLGGPMVGILAGLIAGSHRFAIDIGGFTAVACACSTVVEGLLGGLFSRNIRRGRLQWLKVGLVTVLAECLQMLIIILIARPFERALNLVMVIALPMILFNAMGAALFIGVFDSIFIEQDRQSARRVRLVLHIADQCLPHFQKGLYSLVDMKDAAQIIRQQADLVGAAITDRARVLGYAGKAFEHVSQAPSLPLIVKRTLETGQTHTAHSVEAEDPLAPQLTNHIALCAPLLQKNEIIGSLVILIPKKRLSLDVEHWFVTGLARLLSTQLELSQLELQKKLRRKAEIAALQSQINPHFLFNALSTISMFCREQPARARELLLQLGNYFRNTLQTEQDMVSLSQEMQHVHAYLELEKARFGDKLLVEEEIPNQLHCMVPSLILQPLVENAIRHGAMTEGANCRILIKAMQLPVITCIQVTDNGAGIPHDIIQMLYNDAMEKESVGLTNVHKRLKSIYGEGYGLQFHNAEGANTVTIRIPSRVAEV